MSEILVFENVLCISTGQSYRVYGSVNSCPLPVSPCYATPLLESSEFDAPLCGGARGHGQGAEARAEGRDQGVCAGGAEEGEAEAHARVSGGGGAHGRAGPAGMCADELTRSLMNSPIR
eukprot:1184742-Prorocentrum_minimum.AAC.1